MLWLQHVAVPICRSDRAPLGAQANSRASRAPGPVLGPGTIGKPPIGAMAGGKADKGDPIGLREQVAALFDEWARVLDANANDKVHSNFVAQLQQAGLLKVSPFFADDNS